MISHQHQCIFIHIPKCAGTSIESALGHLDGHTGRSGQDHRTLRMIENPAFTMQALSSIDNLHEFLRTLRHRYFYRFKNPNNKTTLTRQQYESYFKFTIVRNPWARAFSWYKNVIRDDLHLQYYGITAEMPFNEFLHHFAGKGMLRPQTFWLKNYRGEMPLDYIGKFEDLQNTFTEIRQRLGKDDLEFPHKIKGSGEDYTKAYDERSHALIADVYDEDIRAFDYRFGD